MKSLFTFVLCATMVFSGGAIASAQNADILAGVTCEATPESGDLDGDGLSDAVEKLFGTAANRRDTDYDGYSDCEEILNKGWSPDNDNFAFNPLVADLPSIGVQVIGSPIIEVLYEEGEGETISVGTERSTSSSRGSSRSTGGASSSAVESTLSRGSSETVALSVTVGAEVSASLTDFGASVSTEVTAASEQTSSVEYSESTSNESTVSWDSETSQEKTLALAEIETRESQSSVTATEGLIRVAAYIHNAGRISATIEGITLSARTLRAESEIARPLPNMTAEVSPFTLAPGQSFGPISFEARISVAEAKDLLADSSGLIVSSPGVDLLDATGRPFTHNMTDIPTQTARVIIDYGRSIGELGLTTAEDYRVAISPTAQHTTAEALLNDVLKVDVVEGYSLWGVSASERKNVGPGLRSVRGIETGDRANAYWALAHTYNIANGFTRVTKTYDVTRDDVFSLSDIEVRRGDVLHLIFISDVDQDGLGDRLEAVYGTDRLKNDTDRDGLSDAQEVNGWIVAAAYGHKNRNIRVTSNPLIRNDDPSYQNLLETVMDEATGEPVPKRIETQAYDVPVVFYPSCEYAGQGQPQQAGVLHRISEQATTAVNNSIASISVAPDYVVKLVVLPTNQEMRRNRRARPEIVQLESSISCIPELEESENIIARTSCMWIKSRYDTFGDVSDYQDNQLIRACNPLG